ncbi:MAG: hypothetical protein ABFC73_00705 [Clostridiaceae bacterium]
MNIRSESALREWIRACVSAAPIVDMHTHLYAPCFGELLRAELDEVICYHYLIEETVLETRMNPADFWKLDQRRRAELVWNTLFVQKQPVSESCKVILTMFQRDGLDVNRKDLDYYRAYYEAIPKQTYIDDVLRRQHIETLVMTNDPFDAREAAIWLNGAYTADARFLAALRLDELMNYRSAAVETLNEWGYLVERDGAGLPTVVSYPEIRRFLADWLNRTNAVYCAASLSPEFTLRPDSPEAEILTRCILPVCEERDLPVSLMFGVTRRVNPPMGEAGDSLGKVDIRQLHALFRQFPNNRFLITALSRENQHELTAAARIFNNVMLFGCWWFLNNPVVEREMTRMRYEMLGPKFVAQHSDANMVGHMLGKWERFKPILAEVLCENYADLFSLGYRPDDEMIRQEIADLFGAYFCRFTGRKNEVG